MKRTWVLSLFTCVGMLSLVSFLTSNPQITNAATETAKTIYVDLSECIETNYEELNVTFQLVEEGGWEISLSHLDGGVFASSEPVEVASFPKAIETYQFSWKIDETQYIVTFEGVMPLYEETNNYVCLSEYREDNPEPIKGFGYYGARKKNPGATCLTQRVWLYDADLEYAGDYTVGYIREGVLQLVNMDTTVNSFDRLVYRYADIPYELTDAYFIKLGRFCIDSCAKTPLIYGTCFNLRDSSLTMGIVDGADAGLLGMVVEAYLTYGSSPSNGSVGSTISAVFQTFFKNKSASAEDMKATKILDYGGGSYKEGRYYPDVPKSAYFSVNEKWNTLCSNAGVDPKTGEARDWSLDLGFSGDMKKSLLIASGTLFVIIVAGSAYLIWKWRKGSFQ